MAIAPLIVAVAIDGARATWRRAAALGLAMGSIAFAGTLYWVVGVMHRYGDLAWLVAVPVGGLLVSYLALYPALFAVMVRAGIRRFGVGAVWLTPAFWVATEWIRGNIAGGFPWALLGASQSTALPIAQLASVTGVYGLSALVALVSAAAAIASLTTRRVHRIGIVAVALTVVAVTSAGAWRIADGRLTRNGAPLRVGLVQGSVNQDEKYDPRLRDAILERYLGLSRQVIAAGANVVIWPEASTPFYFDVEASLAGPVRRLAAETRTPFVIGTDAYDAAAPGRPERFYNAAVLVGGDGRSKQTYRKMHLVPFGEFVPFKSLLFFVGPLIEAVSDFSAGTEPIVFDADGRRLSVAICYESIYPSVAQAFVERGSQLLATITNDAWFGRSSAAYQHFEQGALRAIEQGRYVVRSANTGISGAVDPYGRTLAETALFQPTSLAVDVRLLTGRTIYSRVGDVVAWIALAISAAVVLVAARAARRQSSINLDATPLHP